VLKYGLLEFPTSFRFHDYQVFKTSRYIAAINQLCHAKRSPATMVGGHAAS
jgi:hypothetical protein